jgi:hypothetical protein
VLNISIPISQSIDSHAFISTLSRFQRQAAQDGDLELSIASIKNYESYSTLLDVLHWERTIGARFPGRKPLPYVTVMIRAIAEQLSISEDHVRQCRTVIKRCLKGERGSVPMLNRRKPRHIR